MTWHPSSTGSGERRRPNGDLSMDPDGWMKRTRAWRCRTVRRVGILLLGSLALVPACAGWPPPSGIRILTAPAPSASERYCAWYGDSDGETLYVGLAPFWSSMRAADDDPAADLLEPGPAWIGRFDLARESWMPPLDVGREGSRAGTWDVHLQDAQLYFTSYFETSGRVDLASGRVTHFDAAGPGLNELAPGPDGGVLVSRYGSGDGAKTGGALLDLDASGEATAHWSLPAPSGYFVAPKTPAWNPIRRRLLATTDLLPEFEGVIRHDAYLLEAGGEWRRRRTPELQFVAASADGVEYRVEAHADGRLWLRRILPPGGSPEDARVLLDSDFDPTHDFAQDLKITPDGRVVVTRWSGQVHVVTPGGRVTTLRLPRPDPTGLYYTAVIHGDRLCASYCADVTVVCVDAPSAEPPGAP